MFLKEIFALLSAVGCFLYPAHWALAAPSGFALQSGEALPPVQEGAGSFVIQSGKNAAIDWESFSIAADESVRFNQADGNSAVLNRVTGTSESVLMGRLLSNGAVYLVNPNGILIGEEAYIDTAGFIASTLDLLGDGLSEKRFVGEGGEVINEGRIHCSVGDVFLIGRKVENSGTISTPNGRQGLLSCCDVVIRPEGTPQLTIRPDEVIDEQTLAENPYALAIRHRGRIEAKESYLVAEEGLCEVSGSVISPSGAVHILGDVVHILDGAEIDVSGKGGGGVILVGGDRQGKNPEVKNAVRTWVGKETLLKADALQQGDGGRVIVWGDEATWHYGQIGIRGGAEGGDGGFAEVSGRDLVYRGFADGRAPMGKAGILLLDPNDITIGSSATTIGGSFSGCMPTPPSTYVIVTGTATNEILNTDLVTQLENCSVLISTMGSTGSGPNSGSISVTSPITVDASSNPWSEATTLTLTASSFISITAAITNTSASTGFTAMNFTADGILSGTNSGITLGSGGVLTTTGGNVMLSGTASGSGSTAVNGVYFNGGSISTTGGNVSVTGSVTGGSGVSQGVLMATTNGIVGNGSTGTIAIGGTSSASGSGSCGVKITSAWTTGTSGSVTFANCTGGSGSGSHGISVGAAFSTSGSIVATNSIQGGIGAGSLGFFQSSSSNIVSSGGGNISITASSLATTGGNCTGISLFAAMSTSTGTITLNGTSGLSSGNSSGIQLNGGTTVSTTGASMSLTQGAITLIGLAQGGGSSFGIVINATNGITSTFGPINISGSSTASGAPSHGFSPEAAWTTGTSGLVTFSNCTGGSGSASYGIAMAGSFATSGSIVATNNIVAGSGNSGIGFSTSQNFASTGAGQTIAITATGGGGSTGGHGISLTGGTLSTVGGTPGTPSITLIGTAASTSTTGTSHGVNISGTGKIHSVNGDILIAGQVPTQPSGTTASVGVNLGVANGVTSTTGNIDVSGTSSAAITNSHGVSIAAAWTTGTSGTLTFGSSITGGTVTIAGCIGGSGTSSHGINVGAAVSTLGNIVATNLIQGGTGSGSVGFASGSNFASTGASSTVQITASSRATAGAAHGISLTGGTLSTNGGSITLNGTSGASNTASYGVNLASSSAVIASTSGGITLSGSSLSSGASSYGVAITNAWTPATTGLITFTNCTGGTGTGSHGVYFAGAFTGSGPVVFSNCTGGNNITTGGNGINVIAAFTTAGNITATNSITGNGNGGIGFASSANFAATGTNNTIAITATASGTSGASHGISLTGGIMSTNGGSITLNGTSGASNTASYGVNLASSNAVIASTSGGINVTGVSTATAAASHGIAVVDAWSAGTSGTLSLTGTAGSGAGSFPIALGAVLTNSGPITFNSAVGITSASEMVTSSGAMIFDSTIDGAVAGGNALTLTAGTGAITLSQAVGGTTSLGTFIISSGSSVTIGGNITASAVAVPIAATLSSAGTTTVNTSGPINFGGSINGTSSGVESLTLNSGASGAITINNVGNAVSLGNLTVANGGTFSFLGTLNLTGNFLQSGMGSAMISGGLTSSGGNVQFDSGVTLTGNTTITAGTSSSIIFMSTINGPYALLLEGQTIDFGDSVGIGTQLLSIGATASGTITVNGNQAVSTGPMFYLGNVTLLTGATIQFTDSGSSGISFQAISGDAISGNTNLTLIAPNTTIDVLIGDVVLSGASGVAGGNLSVNGGSGVTFEGQILTIGGMNANGGAVTLTSSGGSVSVHNINASGGSGSGSGGPISLQPNGNYMGGCGGLPMGLIVLNTDLSLDQDGNLVTLGGGAGGTITLSGSRSCAATVATITSGPSNDIYITGASCTMGPFEAMTALGNITFACSTVTLGDIVALDSLNILASIVNLNLHGDISILNYQGLPYTSPSLHFLGGSEYLQVGDLVPSGPVNAQNLGLSEATFRPQLLFGSQILNFDTSAKPTPSVTSGKTFSLGREQYLIYQLLIADAQLSDMLPIYPIQSPCSLLQMPSYPICFPSIRYNHP